MQLTVATVGSSLHPPWCGAAVVPEIPETDFDSVDDRSELRLGIA